MNTQELFPYLLEVLIMSGLGAVFFIYVLRKETNLHWNRIYLLLLSGLAIVLPLLNWQIAAPWNSGTLSELMLDPVLITSEESGVSVTAWIWGFLWIGSAISLFLLCKRFYSLVRFKQTCRQESVQGITCYLTGGKLGTSSFGNWLFWDETDELTAEQSTLILKHECCHISQRHSLDLLWMDLLRIFYWWNPAFYLIRSLMVANHEALADQAAIKNADDQTYRKLLLRQWTRPRLSLTHEFHFSYSRHRIDMISSKSKSRKWKYLLALSVLALAGGMISCEGSAVAEVLPEIEEMILTDKEPIPTNLNQIKRQIGYPQAARDAGAQGQVVMRILVGEDGKYIRHERLQVADELLAIAVENYLKELEFTPAKKDGNPIQFWVNIPFNFKLLN